MNDLTGAELDSLMEAAVSAPSADNAHAWRLRVGTQALSLLMPGATTMTASRWRLNLLSLGAVCESLVLRGRRLGLHFEFGKPRRSEETMLDIRWLRAEPIADPLADQLLRRHSNRTLLYRGPSLKSADVRRMDAQANEVSNTWLQWLDEPATRRRSCSLVARAESLRFRVRELHQEMFEAVRFDVGWTSSCSTGLPPGSLGVGWHERAFFRLMANWPIQRLMNLIGAHHLLGQRSAALPARFAPHLCAIGATGEIDEAALLAGRLLQRVWCQASELGLAAQVLAAAPIYALPGADGVPVALQQELAEQWRHLCPSGRPYVLLRLGHAPSPQVRTGRPEAAGLRLS